MKTYAADQALHIMALIMEITGLTAEIKAVKKMTANEYQEYAHAARQEARNNGTPFKMASTRGGQINSLEASVRAVENMKLDAERATTEFDIVLENTVKNEETDIMKLFLGA